MHLLQEDGDRTDCRHVIAGKENPRTVPGLPTCSAQDHLKALLIYSHAEADAEAVLCCLRQRFRCEVLYPEQDVSRLRRRRFEYIFASLEALEQTGPDAVAGYKKLAADYPTAKIVVSGPHERLRAVVRLVQAGASDYLTSPVVPAEVDLVTAGIEEAEALRQEVGHLRERTWKNDRALTESHSRLMSETLRKVAVVSATNSSVLLTGETGTGKGVLARFLHRQSPRASKPFVAVHCGAIPEALLESELFGHEKGAFTGATRRKRGKFEVAHTGTIFLDEIGTVSPATQVKLLHILQERTLQRLGGEEDIPVDVRIISATNEDLAAKAADGSFRTDLFYRLNVFPIHIPALRERLEDLALLIGFFLERMNLQSQRDVQGIHAEVLAAFRRYDWPGNIRELENLLERAYILEEGNVLGPDGFPAELFDPGTAMKQIMPIDFSQRLANVRRETTDLVEREYLAVLLERCQGRIGRAARSAGISERQLHKLMVKHSIRKEVFRKKSE